MNDASLLIHDSTDNVPAGLRPGKLKSLTWTRGGVASATPAAAVSSPQAYMQRKLATFTADWQQHQTRAPSLAHALMNCHSSISA